MVIKDNTDVLKEENAAMERLRKTVKEGTSPYHVVEYAGCELKKKGFKELDFRKKWKLEKGKSYFTVPYGTTCFAFSVGKLAGEDSCFQMASAHTDSPGFRIKPVAEVVEKEYLKLNTEVYGGAILNTWLDRPLSIAGKVCLKSKKIYEPKTVLYDSKRPLALIPNLAIHMNKDVNKGIELNKQTHLNPLFGMSRGKEKQEKYFIRFIAGELGVKQEDILDFDLYVYDGEEGLPIGMEEEFISSPRLDNLTSVAAVLYGITENSEKLVSEKNIKIGAFYDNEEIGSRSKQGADSSLTGIFLEKIITGLSMEKEGTMEKVLRSFLLSADVSHCLHPNYPEKNDPVNLSYLNRGVVIKLDSTQKYASDTEAVSSVLQLCGKYGISCQKFVNRSDGTSGSTLGSIQSSWLPMKTVDLGVPLLAMHSARELMGKKDQRAMEMLIKAFYAEE